MTNYLKVGLALLLSAVLLLIFEDTLPPAKTVQQAKFEKWLDQTKLTRPKPDHDFSPYIVIKAASVGEQNNSFDWQLVSDNKNNNLQKIVRLLSQAREANLFALQPETSASEKQAGVVITISSHDKDTGRAGNQLFKTRLSTETVAASSKAQLFLKLLALYAPGDSNSSIALNNSQAKEKKR